MKAIDEGIQCSAGVFFSKLGNVGITGGGGWAGMTQQMLDVT